jgi:hypothetical protein
MKRRFIVACAQTMLFLRSRARSASLRRARSLTRPLTLESVNYARRQFGIARFSCQSAIDLRYIAWLTIFTGTLIVLQSILS